MIPPIGTLGHRFEGFLNPQCAHCGRTPIEVAIDPQQCRRVTLPFEEVKPVPVKVVTALKVKAAS